MKVIAEKPWSYVLFDDGSGWILTLLIGGVIEIDVSVRLTPEEMVEIQRDTKYVDRLVEGFEHGAVSFPRGRSLRQYGHQRDFS